MQRKWKIKVEIKRCKTDIDLSWLHWSGLYSYSFAMVIILVRFQAIPVYLNVMNDDWLLDFSHCNAVNMDFFIQFLHSMASGEPIRTL